MWFSVTQRLLEYQSISVNILFAEIVYTITRLGILPKLMFKV
ncbi:hypothetical protein TcasGA2_TC033904 [Tribolium castaneum]|uniref:Uncharacterized protein n=1 Tax=Tribolium castaneum TaxID=7070 RepID=A0A139W9C5_TRICA|nr:hypothetical protein TcasGA2_TC033904 [Tribolium castaneum]